MKCLGFLLFLKISDCSHYNISRTDIQFNDMHCELMTRSIYITIYFVLVYSFHNMFQSVLRPSSGDATIFQDTNELCVIDMYKG
jgi:hypothetical protein